MNNETLKNELLEQIANWRREADNIEDMIEEAYKRIDELSN